MLTKGNDSEVSALANAAKISHLINGTTIGATTDHSDVSIVPVSLNNNVQRQQSKDPWKRDVWRSVDLETEQKRSHGTALNLIDCRAIQNKLAWKNAERMRQKQIRLEMAKRQDKMNELEEMMENMRLSNLQKSETKLQKNLLEKEQQIIQVKCEIHWERNADIGFKDNH